MKNYIFLLSPVVDALGCGTAVCFTECIADLAVFVAADELEGRDICLTLHTLRVS